MLIITITVTICTPKEMQKVLSRSFANLWQNEFCDISVIFIHTSNSVQFFLTVKLANVHERRTRFSDCRFSNCPIDHSLHRYNHYVIESRNEICEHLGDNSAPSISRNWRNIKKNFLTPLLRRDCRRARCKSETCNRMRVSRLKL